MRKTVLLFAMALVMLLLATSTSLATPPESEIPYEGYFVTCEIIDQGKQWEQGDRLFVRNLRFVGESWAWVPGDPGTLLPMLTGTSAVRLHQDINFATGEATVRAWYTLDSDDPAIEGIWNGRATGEFFDYPNTDGEFFYWAHGTDDLAGYHLEATSFGIQDPEDPRLCGGDPPASIRYVVGTVSYPPGE